MKYLLFLYFFLLSIISSAQLKNGKYDKHCMFGYLKYGNAILTVEKDTFWVSNPNTMSFNFSSSVMSDINGNLQFYTNGISINNKLHYTMKNGNRINPGMFLDNGGWTQKDIGGLPEYQGLISLPSPKNENEYFIINTDINVIYYSNPLYNWFCTSEFYYQKIDMTKNDSIGEVVELNKIITTDTLEVGALTACQHGNGKDWWILVNELRNNTYRKYVLNSSGIKLEGKQQIKEISQLDLSYGRTVAFTPNGEYFIRVSEGPETTIYILQFNRCTGELTNPKKIHFPNGEIFKTAFMSISPNSKFLYIIQYENILQFDLESKDILASIDTVAKYDGFATPYNGCETRFLQSWLGPDGRIYINTGTCGSDYLHVIENPDLKGIACNVKQHAIKLNILNPRTAPNFPNYRLGPLKGSPCDTLNVANKDITLDDFDIKLFPNPASTDIKIDITLKEYDPAIKTEVAIVDISGAIVQKYTMPDFAYLATIDISKLASGVYGVQLKQPKKFGDRVLAVEKLVVVR